MVDAQAGFDLDVGVRGEQFHQAFALGFGEEVFSGHQGPCGLVQLIALAATTTPLNCEEPPRSMLRD